MLYIFGLAQVDKKMSILMLLLVAMIGVSGFLIETVIPNEIQNFSQLRMNAPILFVSILTVSAFCFFFALRKRQSVLETSASKMASYWPCRVYPILIVLAFGAACWGVGELQDDKIANSVRTFTFGAAASILGCLDLTIGWGTGARTGENT
jgi:hypothetical protein